MERHRSLYGDRKANRAQLDCRHKRTGRLPREAPFILRGKRGIRTSRQLPKSAPKRPREAHGATRDVQRGFP